MKSRMTTLILAAVVVLLPLLTITYFCGTVMERQLADSREASLQSLSSVVSRHIYDFYSSQESSSRYLVETAPVQELLSSCAAGKTAGELQQRAERVNEMLDACVRANGSMSGARVIDRSGRVVAASKEEDVGMMMDQTEMYRSIVGGERKYFTPAVTSDGARNLNLTVPVKGPKGQLLGMLQRQINFSVLNLYMDQAKLGKTGYIYVIGPDGIVLYQSISEKNYSFMGEFQSVESLDELVEQVADGKLERSHGVIHYGLYGEQVTAAYKEIPELNWVVVAATPDQEVYVSVTRLRVAGLAVAAAMSALLLWAGLRRNRRWSALLYVADAFYQNWLKERWIARTVRSSGTGREGPAMGKRRGIGKSKRAAQAEPVCWENAPSLPVWEQSPREEQLRYLEETDLLTHLYNRTGLRRWMKERLHSRCREAVMMVELDGFRELNAEFGPEFGNAVLMETGLRLHRYLGENCAIARLRAGRFFIHYMDWSPGEEPERMAERVRNEIRDICVVRERTVHIGASIGIYYIKDGTEDQRTLFVKSEAAVHKAKELGENISVTYSETMKESEVQAEEACL